MTTWTVTPSDGVTINQSTGQITFPSNDCTGKPLAEDIEYTISVTSDTGCVAETSYTVPKFELHLTQTATVFATYRLRTSGVELDFQYPATTLTVLGDVAYLDSCAPKVPISSVVDAFKEAINDGTYCIFMSSKAGNMLNADEWLDTIGTGLTLGDTVIVTRDGWHQLPTNSSIIDIAFELHNGKDSSYEGKQSNSIVLKPNGICEITIVLKQGYEIAL